MSIYVAIGLISAATLLLEISFLRLFAVQQFYHFAFMAVSLALLGAGASGSVLSIRPRRWSPAIFAWYLGSTTVASYLVINFLPFDSFSIAWDSRQLLFLAIYFLARCPILLCRPVVGGEMAASSAKSDGRSHRIYGANLLGSGFGSLASLLVLTWSGGRTVLVAAILGLLSGFLFLLSKKNTSWPGAIKSQPVAGLLTIALLLICIGLLISRPAFWAQRLSPYKTLSTLLQTLDAQHTVSTWDQQPELTSSKAAPYIPYPGSAFLPR